MPARANCATTAIERPSAINVALRQSASDLERAEIIARTFQRGGFRAVLRESGETYRKSELLETAARCYAQIDDRDTAIALLEACSRRRCSDLVSLNVEPDFDGLRDDPRFRELVRKVGPAAAATPASDRAE